MTIRNPFLDVNWARQPTDFRKVLADFDAQINQIAQANRDARDPEKIFQALDVQPGDRVRLTELLGVGSSNPNRLTASDASTLEGVVQEVRSRYGASRIQIKGFAVQGNNIFWPVRNYKIEVLHRAYRWTPEDEAIVVATGLSRGSWEGYREDTRESYRAQWRPRLEKIRAALGIESAPDATSVE